MDAKITLSFDRTVIEKAKDYAENKGISLSRLTEFVLRQITEHQYKNLEDFPIEDWVKEIAEGKATYRTSSQSSKSMKKEYLATRK